MTSAQSLCVVGAGPAGLVTAKVFLEDGFDVTVFEKYDEIGGTWSSHRRYVNLNHQLDKGIFEFSGMPNDEAYEEAESIQAYLREYADRFDVADRIEFETEVVDMTETTDGWTVTTRDPRGDTQSRDFMYVVVCQGLHHLPKIPDVPGIDDFTGVVRHSSEVDSPDILDDNRVVVVGGGKSAFDLAVEAARAGRSATFVFRKANWMIPKKLLGGRLPHRYVLYTRFGESLQPQYFNDDCVRLIDRLPASVKDRLWAIVHRDAIRSAGLHRVDPDLVPETELRHDIAHAGVMPDEFADLVESGEITPIRSVVDRMDADGLHLESGAHVEADVVVFATGFRKDVPFFGDDAGIKTEDGQFYLYRSLLPPTMDNIGFVGTRETFNNFLSMEISAHWLAAYFQDELVSMPTREEMRGTIDRRLEWQESVLPNTKGFDFGPYDLHCVDELLLDMGVETRRSDPITEYFRPRARARHYTDLRRERKRAGAADPQAESGSGIASTVASLLF